MFRISEEANAVVVVVVVVGDGKHNGRRYKERAINHGSSKAQREEDGKQHSKLFSYANGEAAETAEGHRADGLQELTISGE